MGKVGWFITLSRWRFQALPAFFVKQIQHATSKNIKKELDFRLLFDYRVCVMKNSEYTKEDLLAQMSLEELVDYEDWLDDVASKDEEKWGAVSDYADTHSYEIEMTDILFIRPVVTLDIETFSL